MEESLKKLGNADFRLYKSMGAWHRDVSDMLAYVNDVLHPQGFDAITEDNFAALKQMLKRAEK